jgi:hypothetical protein
VHHWLMRVAQVVAHQRRRDSSCHTRAIALHALAETLIDRGLERIEAC